MAQGLVKKQGTSKPATKSAHNAGVTKKGSRTITPKKAKLAKQAKMNKKFTSGLTAKTEAMLGARAGHLELLGQGRKKTSTATGDKSKKPTAGGAGKKGSNAG
ncbi:hypothetical protein B0A52_00559 [Exophiala mesophila]|uniref:Uncharacterized protein n=1 Tax=Exophiala mesophila TaxID=212818 RepID=A0A438NHK4_EXOME|nr:hypothetical protein B0A52_00559 [Exophiala mesophila]